MAEHLAYCRATATEVPEKNVGMQIDGLIRSLLPLVLYTIGKPEVGLHKKDGAASSNAQC